jgi:hypothetical protein
VVTVSEFEQRVQAAIDTIPAEARQQPCACGGQEDRYCYSDECTGRLLGFRLAQWSSDQRAERAAHVIGTQQREQLDALRGDRHA